MCIRDRVWIEGSWLTFDPTPPSAIDEARKASLAGALFDALSRAWDRATPGELAEISAGLGVVAAAWFFLRGRGGRGRDTSDLASRGPLPAGFEALERLLEQHGQVRPASEPIETFAARLEAARPDAFGRAAAELLLRYSRHSYGGQGELGPLANDVPRFATATVEPRRR